jgi:hypothetical protein
VQNIFLFWPKQEFLFRSADCSTIGSRIPKH